MPRTAAVILGLFFCYCLFVQVFFLGHFTKGIARPLSRLIFVPAASRGDEYLPYGRLIELTRGAMAFDGPVDHETAFDRALSAGVWQLSVQDLADELRLRVSKEELAAYPVDEAQLADQLAAAGWNTDDYRKYIVKPLLLAQKVEAGVAESDTFQSDAKQSLESLIKKVEQGMPIADVAQNFSQDPSALYRGDLGIMSLSSVPEWLRPATTLSVGERSGILSSPEAFWYVEMIAYYPSEGGDPAVHFRGIAVKKRSLSTIIDDRRAENPGWVFIW